MTRLAVPTTTATSLGARLAWGTVAGIGLAALLIGVPLALAAAFGWPPPVPSDAAVDYPHLHEAELGRIALAWAGWAVWVWLAGTVTVQLVQMLRWGIHPETMRDTASPARWLASALIGTVATAIPAAGAFAATPTPAITTTGLDTGADATDQTPTARPLVWASPTDADSTATTTSAAVAHNGEASSVHIVQEGESLWDLADQYYGDPQRHGRIWEANRGKAFDDGRTFTDPAKIWPGWDLVIPGSTGPTDTEPAGDELVHETVEDGESLWGYADEYLGDGTRYNEIADANADRVQADGRTLTDPSHIVNGWDIIIPVESESETAPPATETEPETSQPAAPVPDAGDDGPVDEPPTDETTETEQEPQATTPAPEVTNDADAGEPESDSILDAVPFGIWLTGGTCLAAATIAALAVRLRRRRNRAPADPTTPRADEPMTGRLADLEAVIEAENRKLTTPASDTSIPEPLTVAVSAERDPVDLRDLARGGIGLLGPGQHGVARAAIIAAATARAHVHLTEAANLRLDLEAQQFPRNVRVVDVLSDAFDAAVAESLIVCADTEIDEHTQAGIGGFLAADGRGAIILGDWAPAAVRLAGDGTVEDATGTVAQHLGMLHTADRDTTVALLQGLRDEEDPPTEAIPVPSPVLDTEPIEDLDERPAPESDDRADEDDPASGEDGARATESEPEAAPDAAAATTPAPYLCLFGTPEVYVGETPIVFKKGRRAKAFLAALALADEPVSRQDLLDAVLPGYDDLAKARNNLNSIGSAIRKDFREATGADPRVYHWDQQTDRYELDPTATDRDAFDAAEQAAALTTNPAEAADHLEEVVRLYTGDLAPDLHTPQADQLRRQYRAATARALRRLADHCAESGDTARAEHYRSRARALAPETDSS
jgi:nucleoid-associated protein YgaU